MAELIENSSMNTSEYASNSKGNAALTLGIIGTALSGLNMLGNGISLFGNNSSNSSNTGNNIGTSTNGTTVAMPNNVEETYIERKMNQDLLNLTKTGYEEKILGILQLNDIYNKLDKQDIDNSFMLYKYSRDNKDALEDKITALTAKVDVMAAVRPYQDALINAKIDSASHAADFKLLQRTQYMINGQLVVPDTSLSGFPSYSGTTGVF